MKNTLNILKIISEESRLRIFMALRDQELCVCQIVALLGLAASTTSKHLSLMYQADIIEQRKEGRWAHYKVSPEWLHNNAKFADWLLGTLKDSGKIKSDRTRLTEIFAMPPEQLCQPDDRCQPDKPAVRNRGHKK